MSAASPAQPATWTLVRHSEALAVVRLPLGADLPDWVSSATLMSITATAAETSIVCTAGAVPRKSRAEGPFTAFEVAGPLDFAETGVLAALLAPLAAAEVSVFVISTFDTDWVLVREEAAELAAETWTAAGHTLTTPTPRSST